MTEDPLLLLADELRDLGSRMLSTADQLSQRATAPPEPVAPPAPTPAVTPGPWQSAEAWVQRMDDVPPPRPEPKGPIWDRLRVRSIAWLACSAASGLLVGVAALLLAAWVVRRLRPAWLPANFAAVAGGTGVAVLAQAAMRAVPVDHLAVALLALAVVFALAAMWGESRGTLLARGLYAVTGFVVALFHALPVTVLVSSPLFPPYPTTLVDAVTAGLLLVLTGLVYVVALLRLDPSVPTPVWPVIGLAGLYGSTGVVLCTTMLVADDRTGFLVGHVLVTVCWAVGALVLLAKGISRLPLRIAGLTLVGAAVAKLFLFDLAALDGLARAAVFLGAGIALLAAGVRYAQLVSRRRAE